MQPSRPLLRHAVNAIIIQNSCFTAAEVLHIFKAAAFGVTRVGAARSSHWGFRSFSSASSSASSATSSATSSEHSDGITNSSHASDSGGELPEEAQIKLWKSRRSASPFRAALQPLGHQQRTQQMEALIAAGLTGDMALRVLKAYEKDVARLRCALPGDAFARHVGKVLQLQSSFPDLKLPYMIASDPRLLARPAPVLRDQLSTLRRELELWFPPGVAAAFLSNALSLEGLLERPAELVNKLVVACDLYRAVIHREPPIGMLTCRASHIYSSATVLRRKLEGLVDMLGRHHAHQAVCRSPHLLSSSTERLSANAASIRAQLLPPGEGGANAGPGGPGGDGGFSAMMVKQPRLLSTRSALVEDNFRVLRAALGCSEQQALAIVRGYPAVLTLSPTNVSVKVDDLKVALRTSLEGLSTVLRQQPTLLGLTMENIRDKLEGISRLFKCTPDAAAVAARRCPSLLVLTADLLEHKMGMMAQNFGLSEDEAASCFRRAPQLLCYAPETLAAKAGRLREGLGLSQEMGRAYVMGNPSGLLLCVDALLARVALFRQLCARSPNWSRPADAAPVAVMRRVGSSGRRLLLRMDYLLSTGQDREVCVSAVDRMTNEQWRARVGDGYGPWEAERRRQLEEAAEEEGSALWRAAMGIKARGGAAEGQAGGGGSGRVGALPASGASGGGGGSRTSGSRSGAGPEGLHLAPRATSSAGAGAGGGQAGGSGSGSGESDGGGAAWGVGAAVVAHAPSVSGGSMWGCVPGSSSSISSSSSSSSGSSTDFWLRGNAANKAVAAGRGSSRSFHGLGPLRGDTHSSSSSSTSTSTSGSSSSSAAVTSARGVQASAILCLAACLAAPLAQLWALPLAAAAAAAAAPASGALPLLAAWALLHAQQRDAWRRSVERQQEQQEAALPLVL